MRTRSRLTRDLPAFQRTELACRERGPRMNILVDHTIRGRFHRDESIKVVLDKDPDLFRPRVDGRLKMGYASRQVLVRRVWVNCGKESLGVERL